MIKFLISESAEEISPKIPHPIKFKLLSHLIKRGKSKRWSQIDNYTEMTKR